MLLVHYIYKNFSLSMNLYLKQMPAIFLMLLILGGTASAKKFTLENQKIDALKFALEKATAKQQLSQAGGISLNLGVAYYKINLDSAFRYYQMAEQFMLRSGDSTYLPRVYLNTGIIQKKRGYFNKALQSYFQALQLIQDDQQAVASVNNSIGSLYNKTNRPHDAIPYYQKALDYYRMSQDTVRTNRVYGNLANVLTKLQLYDSALTYYFKSYEIKKTAGDTLGMATLLNNIGWTYLESNELDQAEEHLQRALELKRTMNELLEINKTMNQLGEVYLRKKEYNKAYEFLSLALEITRDNNLRNDEKEILINLSNYYEALGQHDQQSEVLMQYIILDDSLFNVEKLNTMRNMESRFKDQQITFLEKTENALKTQAQQQEYLLFWAFIAIATLACAIAVAVIFIVKFHRSSQLNYQLKKENQHSTKNHLQTLSSLFSLQHQALEDLQAKEALADSRNRVNAINLIHQLLYEENSQQQIVRFNHYIEKLAEALKSGYQADDLRITFSIANSHHSFNADFMLNIGLLLNELVTNAIKHGSSTTHSSLHPDEIQVKAHVIENASIFLEVRDNGIGLPDTTHSDFSQPATHASFGMQLIDLMCKQLKAQKTLFNDNGAVFQFSIPFPS